MVQSTTKRGVNTMTTATTTKKRNTTKNCTNLVQTINNTQTQGETTMKTQNNNTQHTAESTTGLQALDTATLSKAEQKKLDDIRFKANAKAEQYKNTTYNDNGDIEYKDSDGDLVVIPAVEYGISTGAPDLSRFTNIKNKDLKKAFNALDSISRKQRLTIVEKGKVYADIYDRRLWKQDAAALGMKTKSFDEFCKSILLVPKNTIYRTIRVYRMCADSTGKIDPRIAMIPDAILNKLEVAHATYEQILMILDSIDDLKTPQDVIDTITQKALAIESHAETADTAETAETADTADTTEESDNRVVFKCGKRLYRIPQEVLDTPANLFAYCQNNTLINIKGVEHSKCIFDVFFNVSTQYIIIHDEKFEHIETYYRSK